VLRRGASCSTAGSEAVDGGAEGGAAGRESLGGNEGLGAVAMLAIPGLLAAGPVVFPRRAVASAVAETPMSRLFASARDHSSSSTIWRYHRRDQASASRRSMPSVR